MRIVYFTHSVVSCWNHGNAHFQRGILRSLAALGHEVAAYEPARGWSRENLLRDHGVAALQPVPDVPVHTYDGLAGLEAAVAAADAVIVHEWTDPAVIAALGALRRHARFTLLFHDTHHRAVSDPAALRTLDLAGYDAVLAFGATLAEVYRGWGWGDRVFVWHEAADTALFRPPGEPPDARSAVWIGNWGDGERSAELESMLLRPTQAEAVQLDIHGVRYPADALAMLARYGARYHGWLANSAVPSVFARHRFTVHVPRRFYTQILPGIPTIRVFEALACGIPLITAAWTDSENLFRPGEDYLLARNESEMRRHMRDLMADDGLAGRLAASGLARIRTHHSCDIRAVELLGILGRLRSIPNAA